MHPPNDHDLLRAMRRGDHAAMQALHSRHAPRVLAFSRAMFRDPPLAEDVSQQAWLALLSLPDRALDDIADLGAWLVITARNAGLGMLRSAKRSRKRVHAVSGLDRSQSPAAAVDPELFHALDTLPESDRELLIFKHVADLTFQQIADVLSEPRSTVASRYAAALDRLRTRLRMSKEVTNA